MAPCITPLILLISLTAISPSQAQRSSRSEDPVYFGKSLNQWIQDLKSPSHLTRSLAAQSLQLIGRRARKAIPHLLPLLDDKAKNVRYWTERAVRAIGKPRPEDTRAILDLIIQEKWSRTVKRTAWGLISNSPSLKLKEQDVPVLSKWLQSEDPGRRVSLLKILQKSPRPGSLIPVIRTVLKTEKDPQVRAEAFRALVHLQHHSVDGLRELLQRPELKVQRQAIVALGKLGSKAKAAVPDLITYCKRQQDQQNQLAVISALKRMDAIDGLRELLKASELKVQRPVIVTLGDFGPRAKAAVPDLIAYCKKQESTQDQLAVISALKQMDAIDGLRELLKAPGIKVQRPVIVALGDFGPRAKAAVPDLRKILSKDQSPLALDAMVALGKIGPEAIAAVPDLIAFCKKQKNIQEQMAVLTALSRIDVNKAPELITYLKENDPQFRQEWVALKPERALSNALQSGQLQQGEVTLKLFLEQGPKDDRARFALGAIQFFRAIEGLGQSWHTYGLKSSNITLPFLRLPVPKNPGPKAITYRVFRQILADFQSDLMKAEKTLRPIRDEKARLAIKLSLIRLDLDGDGKPNDSFRKILRVIIGQPLDFLRDNPDFLVKFDRGDVAWLRAYCHLLTGMLDVFLAFDTESLFNLVADDFFAKPKTKAVPEDREFRIFGRTILHIEEPKRLSHFRDHLLQVIGLNRETWKHIRAEKDNDHEWLPHPKQKGALALPVRDAMIDAWLGALAELELVLQGKKGLSTGDSNRTLNLKAFLEDPPKTLDLSEDPPKKYLGKLPEIDQKKLDRVEEAFGQTGLFGYAAWFN